MSSDEIPEWVVKLRDVLSNRLPSDISDDFKVRFLESTNDGQFNWNHIYHQLSAYILEKELDTVKPLNLRESIDKIIEMHKADNHNSEEWINHCINVNALSESAESAKTEHLAKLTAWSTASSDDWIIVLPSIITMAVSSKWLTYEAVADKLLELMEKEE